MCCNECFQGNEDLVVATLPEWAVKCKYARGMKTLFEESICARYEILQAENPKSYKRRKLMKSAKLVETCKHETINHYYSSTDVNGKEFHINICYKCRKTFRVEPPDEVKVFLN